MGLILLSPFALLKRDIVLTVGYVTEYVAADAARQVPQQDGLGEYHGQSSLASGMNQQRSSSIVAQTECTTVSRTSTLDGYFDVPSLETLGTWTSEKTLDLDTSISIVTQLSIDRLSMLENQCRSWEDPLVAVVYVPLSKSKKNNGNNRQPYGMKSSLMDIQRSIDSFFRVMERTADTCALHVQLVGQVVEDERSSPYPINALRNRAMALAQTPLVFVLDVDFVASPRLGLPGDGYKDAEVWDRLLGLASHKGAIVVPAFELVDGHTMEPFIGENLVRSLVVAGKDELRKAYKQELIGAFNARDFEAGHGPTNTSRWVRQRDPSDWYEVKYEVNYEPFVILSRSNVPAADERFVGYGANKLVFVRSLEASGFTFHVQGSGYAIHVPHAKTRAANVFIAHRKGHSRDPMDVCI